MGALTSRRALGLVLAILVWLVPSRALAQSETTEYYGLDTTGSVRVVFDAAGTVLTRVDYGPFGEQLAAAPGAPNDKYAGLFRDDETGLDYAQARQYNPRIGRFTSVDPVYSGLFEPQRWNRYAYALNSPLTLVDPEGLQADSGQKCTSTSVAVEGGYVETVNCTTSSVGGMGIGGVLAWLGGRLADTFTGAVPVGGPEADLLPIRHSGFRPSPAVDRVVDVAIAAVAVVAVVKSAAASAVAETVAAKSAASAIKDGTSVYRVFGGQARGFGRSWTTVNPGNVKDFRRAAGLWPENSGQFIVEGRLTSLDGVLFRDALPGPNGGGGLPELVIPSPGSQVCIVCVSGVNPPF